MFRVSREVYGRNVEEEDEEDEKNAMKMKNTMNVCREFGCLICVRSEK